MLRMGKHRYLVEDNDLYGDGTVITSTTQPGLCPVQMGTHVGGGHCHGSAWGSIRNNRLFNGPGSSHFMNQYVVYTIIFMRLTTPSVYRQFLCRDCRCLLVRACKHCVLDTRCQ